MRSSADLASQLRAVLTQEEAKLQAISEVASNSRAGGAIGWSRKQELGHLLDSATNNRIRLVKAAIHGTYTGPRYEQDEWVQLGGYARLPWQQLVQFWLATNELFAIAIESTPDTALTALCRIADSEPVTLEFLMIDYILHMQHHLDHILDRPQLTAYPGAAARV